MICREICLYGRVQGVWFRESTRKAALHLGVTGWIKNQPNGTVIGLFYGALEAVNALIAWCHRGPPMAHVSHVEVSPCRQQNVSETEKKVFVVRV